MKKKPKQEIIFLFSFKIQLSQQAKSSHNETSLTYFRFEEKNPGQNFKRPAKTPTSKASLPSMKKIVYVYFIGKLHKYTIKRKYIPILFYRHVFVQIHSTLSLHV